MRLRWCSYYNLQKRKKNRPAWRLSDVIDATYYYLITPYHDQRFEEVEDGEDGYHVLPESIT